MKHIRYPVTAAFDEHCCDDDTYKHIAKPLVLDAVMNGGVSTILMFGQTGAGKSFTMTGIETRMAHSIFQALDTSHDESQPVVTIQFVELCGSKEIRDLLVKKSGDVKLAEDKDGSVRILNAASCEVTSPEELLSRILMAKGRRATEATDKNGVSSRSHAVCQISVTNENISSKRGLLTLIDCAGSERRHDSMYHSSERQKESSEINASLYSLKECIRARANDITVVPFRSSSLTRILKESFVRDGARLCVIACVAPNATDTNHTMETLKTVASIVGVEDQIKESSACTVEPPTLTTATRTAVLAPKQWTHERLIKFLAHKKVSGVQLTEKHDGRALMKMSVMNIKTHLLPDRDEDKAKKIFDLLRKENDRVAAHNKVERDRIKRDKKLAAAHRG